MAARIKVKSESAHEEPVSAQQPVSSPNPSPTEMPEAERVARKIVRATNDLEHVDLSELYAKNCISVESSLGEEASIHGLPALEEKLEAWLAKVETAHWTPVHVFVNGNAICIEWQAELKMRDGRAIDFEEIAIHEVENGKIVSERFFYDPSALSAPPTVSTEPEAEPEALEAQAELPMPPMVAVAKPELAQAPMESEAEAETESEPELVAERTPFFPTFELEDDEPGTPIDPMDL